MGLKRRDFLQGAGLALAMLGADNLGLAPLAHRYHQVLAEPTRRKLALLVGINQYRGVSLAGCVTDVELQRELLTYRFGFQPQDILTLTDQQATRSAIESAFLSHLAEQAQPGDVVVFHFSGYGGKVITSPASEAAKFSLVPVDGVVSEEDSTPSNDLLEETLGRLVRSLETDKVTTVLDASYTYPGKSLLGNLHIRTRPALNPIQVAEAELAFQAQLAGQTAQPSRSSFPGVLLNAAAPDQLATETRWNSFSAGLLTYALTRYLWQATPATSMRVVFSRAKMQVEQLATQDQQPQINGQKLQDQLPYYLPVTTSGADGVITGFDDSKTIQLWLAGLPAALLEQYGANSLFTVVGSDAETTTPPTYLQLLSRDGLTAKAKIYKKDTPLENLDPTALVNVGQFIRERVRILPKNISLTVALDSSLERIERVDAISAFTAVPRVSSAIAGEQSADYVFSKIQSSKTQPPAPTQVASVGNIAHILAGATPTQSSYGLFSLGQDAIPNTAGESGEAVKFAVRRLVPKLQTLLAAKLLNLTVNDTSSQLAVRATMEQLSPQPQPLLQRETIAFSQQTKRARFLLLGETNGLLNLSVGDRIQYRIENSSPHLLYILWFNLDSSGNLIAFLAPSQKAESSSSNVSPVSPDTPQPPLSIGSSIASGSALTLPPAVPSLQWTVKAPLGLVETYLICSRAPFSQTQSLLESTLHPSTAAFYSLSNPLEVAQSILQDLQQASDTAAQVVAASPDTYALDVDNWASLRFVYQVV